MGRPGWASQRSTRACWFMSSFAIALVMCAPTLASAGTVTIDVTSDSHQSPVFETVYDPLARDPAIWNEFKYDARAYPLLGGYTENKSLPTVHIFGPVKNGDYRVVANLYGQPAITYRYFYSYQASNPLMYSVDVGPQPDCAEFELEPVEISDGQFDLYIQRADAIAGPEFYFGWAWVTLTPINDVPLATSDSYHTAESDPLVVAAPGVLANDVDADGDTLTAVKAGDPAHGTVIVRSDGSFTYAPTPGWTGNDSFLYKANDGTTDSVPATVSITVAPRSPTTIRRTSPSKTIGYGSVYKLTGSLSSAAPMPKNQRILLEQSTDGATFTPTSLTAYTGADGAFLFSVKPTRKTWYRARFAATTSYHGSTGPATVVSVRPYVQTPKAPKTMKRSKRYPVYGSLKPGHARGSKPVRVYLYKKAGTKWVKKGYVKAVAYDDQGHTRYKAKVRLTSKGTWRLRAYAPADSRHVKAWSSGYDTVRVQ